MEKVFKQDSTNISRVAKAKDILSVVLRKIGYRPSIEGDVHQAVQNAVKRNKEYIQVNRQIYKAEELKEIDSISNYHIVVFNGKNTHLDREQRSTIAYILQNIDYSNPKEILKQFTIKPNEFKIPLIMIVERLAKHNKIIDYGQLSLVKNELEFYTEHMFNFKINIDTSKESIEDLIKNENNYEIINKNPVKLKQLYPGIDHYYSKNSGDSLDKNLLKEYNPLINDSKIDTILAVIDNLDYSIITPLE